MNQENPPTNRSAAEEMYAAEGLTEGPALDFERLFDAPDCLAAMEGNKNEKDLYDEVSDVVDTEKFFKQGGTPRDIVRVIRIVLKEKKAEWPTYEDIKFKEIWGELERNGMPMRPAPSRHD
jgi:hypothetical protein